MMNINMFKHAPITTNPNKTAPGRNRNKNLLKIDDQNLSKISLKTLQNEEVSTIDQTNSINLMQSGSVQELTILQK